MLTIPITDIRVRPDRQRRSFDPVALYDLAQSIKARGLLHAILIDSEGFLVAGERRLRAITEHVLPLGGSFTYAGHEIEPGEIPFIEVASTDPLELEEIELAENKERADLTWQEAAQAHARLHTLRQAQVQRHNSAALTQEALLPLPGPSAIALEIHGPDANNFQKDTVRQEILIASHLLTKPEVAKAPTLKEAFKVLKKLEDADRNRALAIAVGETFSSADHEVHNLDCRDWMTEYCYTDEPHAGLFDVILTDPPYGIDAQDFGDAAGRLSQIDHVYDDSYEAWQALMREWCLLSYAITKPLAHAYVFCDIDRFHELKALMQAAGWFVNRTPFTNYKQNSGRVPHPEFGPRRQSEWLLYAVKGKKPTNFIGSDVIVSGADEQLSHGAQKPVALYEELLRRSVKPGDLVLDTFGGTGTLLPAAHGLKCKATVIEQSPIYYGLCLGRLKGLDAQQELAV